MCRPMPRRRRPVKKTPPARPSRRHRLPAVCPHASVERWAVDEHRIGLKPMLQKVWCSDGQRPRAPVQHRYQWRSLVGCVHPASGRTIFHLASSVSIPLFETELAAFAEEVGAGPRTQIVLVLDGAGWHASPRLQVPEPTFRTPIGLLWGISNTGAPSASISGWSHRRHTYVEHWLSRFVSTSSRGLGCAGAPLAT